MSSGALRVVTGADVDKVLDNLDFQKAVDSQAQVFAAYSSPQEKDASGISPLQLPLRHVISSPEHSMLFMPARVAQKTSIKIVSVPTAGSEGLPGSTLVLDEKSGKMRAIVNARRLTALRNAAGSVLSYQALNAGKDPTPTNIVIFGSGAQGESHARGFMETYPSISSCVVVARKSTPRSTGLVEKLAKAFPKVDVKEGVASYPDGTSGGGFDLSAAVSAADIICTMTSSTKALFASKDVKAGAHCCLVGSYKKHMREIEDDLVKRAGVVLVDSREACGAEAGELQELKDDDMVEIGELATESTKKAARDKVNGKGDVNVYKSVGLGVQDVSIAAVVLDEAERMDLGVVIPDYD